MQITLSPEQEAQLSRIAAQSGRAADDLALEAVELYLAHERQFEIAVEAGRAAARRGEFVSQSEVWAGVEAELN